MSGIGLEGAELCQPDVSMVRLLVHNFPECEMIRHITLSSFLQFAHRHVDKKATIEGNGCTVHVCTSPACQEQRGACDVLGRTKTIRRDLVDDDVPRSFKKLGRHCKIQVNETTKI